MVFLNFGQLLLINSGSSATIGIAVLCHYFCMFLVKNLKAKQVGKLGAKCLENKKLIVSKFFSLFYCFLYLQLLMVLFVQKSFR